MAGKRKTTRVLLVDDHAVVRQGVSSMLGVEPGIDVCGEAGSYAEALALMKELDPTFAVVDISLAGQDGLELVKRIRNGWPDTLVLVLSMHSDRVYAERALRAGAHGYVMKDEPQETLLAAIRKIQDGGIYVSEELQASWVRRMVAGDSTELTPIERLTNRELEVFRLIGTGQGTREIATNLHLSVKTVESYRENIKVKLDLNSSIELIRHATLWVHHESGG